MDNGELIIQLYPEFGYPSSLWAGGAFLVRPPESGFFLMPEDIGIEGADSERILSWTRAFHENFVDYTGTFHKRPVWTDGFDRFAWYDRGWEIVAFLRDKFPAAIVKPQFARYVFSANEIRENFGKSPICMTGENLPGHIDIRELNSAVKTESGENKPRE